MKRLLFLAILTILTGLWVFTEIEQALLRPRSEEEGRGASYLKYFVAEKILRLSLTPGLSGNPQTEKLLENASASLEEIVKEQPENGKALCLYGIVQGERGRSQEALKFFKMAEKDRANAALAALLGRIYSGDVRSDLKGRSG